jgi:hypothetical protein
MKRAAAIAAVATFSSAFQVPLCAQPGVAEARRVVKPYATRAVNEVGQSPSTPLGLVQVQATPRSCLWDRDLWPLDLKYTFVSHCKFVWSVWEYALLGGGVPISICFLPGKPEISSELDPIVVFDRALIEFQQSYNWGGGPIFHLGSWTFKDEPKTLACDRAIEVKRATEPNFYHGLVGAYYASDEHGGYVSYEKDNKPRLPHCSGHPWEERK